MSKSIKKLDKKTLRKSWFLWSMGNLSSMSFEWLEGMGFCASMIPVIKKLYGGNKEEEIKALKRHAAFYNTEPQVGAVINGIACGMEEERANGKSIDGDMINNIKLSLMGPLAGIGDAMIPGMYIPLLISIGIGMSQNGSPLGAIFYILTYLITITGLSYFLFFKGYTLGVKSIDLVVGDIASRVRSSFNLLGSIVVGGVGALYVSVKTNLIIKTGGDADVNVMSILDNIFPNLLGLVVLIFSWHLMSHKKFSPLKLMGLLFLVAILGVALGLF